MASGRNGNRLMHTLLRKNLKKMLYKDKYIFLHLAPMKIRTTAIAALLFLYPLASHSADVAGAPTSAEMPAQQQAEPNSVQKLLNYAVGLTGINYKFGGKSPETGFDCSGYVRYVFKQVGGMSLPHNALAISKVGEKISNNELRPGDLVFFTTLRRTISHVGIYLGNNQFIHASSTRTGVVEISDLRDSYWARTFDGARRVNPFGAPGEAGNE